MSILGDAREEESGKKKKKKQDEPSSAFQRFRVDHLLSDLLNKFPPRVLQVIQSNSFRFAQPKHFQWEVNTKSILSFCTQ